jgi:hypothetical protein
MKQVLLLLLINAAFLNATNAQSTDYVSENFVIMRTQALKVSSVAYVKQILGVDFKTKDNSVIAGFGLNDDFYTDNGKGNDKVANDGLFTSVVSYTIPKEKLADFDKEGIYVFSNNIYSDTRFKHMEELNNLLGGNGSSLQKISINCEIISCTCAECHCTACNYNWGQNLNWCFKIGKCTISIGW